MHQYLKAIGFSNIKTKEELDNLVREVEWDYTHHELVGLDQEWDFCEFQKEYGPGLGLATFGYMDQEEIYYKEYYYPYFLGTGITSYAEVTVEKKIDREEYVGICEDLKVGISLIFKLQNAIEYLREMQKNKGRLGNVSVTLSGLAQSGTVLLPIKKDEVQRQRIKEEVKNRLTLMNEAKNGDQQAMESLTLDDIDTYSQVSKRLVSEDVFSIVDTYIMPYGIECDVYSVMGEIRSLTAVENEVTQEPLYIMGLEINGLNFDVCVPQKAIFGEPAVGRRFKGNVWLQGYLNFR